MKLLLWWPLVIIASTAGACLVMLGSVESPLRPAIVFWFLLVCPGMAFVRLLDIAECFAELSIAIALSIGLDVAVSETMVLTKLWSPEWGLGVLACLSLVGVAMQVHRASDRYDAQVRIP